MSKANPFVSFDPEKEGYARFNYILFLVTPMILASAIAGVASAYGGREKASPLVDAHLLNQIHIFWKGAAYGAVGAALLQFGAGFYGLGAAALWILARTILGMEALGRKEPYANPKSWLF